MFSRIVRFCGGCKSRRRARGFFTFHRKKSRISSALIRRINHACISAFPSLSLPRVFVLATCLDNPRFTRQKAEQEGSRCGVESIAGAKSTFFRDFRNGTADRLGTSFGSKSRLRGEENRLLSATVMTNGFATSSTRSTPFDPGREVERRVQTFTTESTTREAAMTTANERQSSHAPPLTHANNSVHRLEFRERDSRGHKGHLQHAT